MLRRASALALALLVLPANGRAMLWPNAIEQVERKLGDPDVTERRAAAQRLAELPERTARRLARRALADPDVEVRVTAASLALELGEPSLSELVLGWLTDPERRIRRMAAEVLGYEPNPRAVEALGRALSDGDPEVRAKVAEALGASRNRDATLPLLGRLDDSIPDVRRAVVEALESLRDPRSLVPLIGKIQDARPDVRSSVARALGRLGDKRAASALVLSLRDQEADVRRAAVEALGELAEPTSLVSILSLLESETDPTVREAALSALAGFSDPSAEQSLIAALGSGSEREQQAAAQALSRRGPAASSALSRCVEFDPRPAQTEGCALALAEMGGSDASRALGRAMERGVLAPAAGLTALARLGDESALPSVLSRLADPDAVVRVAAVEASRAILDPRHDHGSAIDPIVERLKSAKPTLEERAALLELLGRTGSARAVSSLATFTAEGQNPVLRRAALEALGLLGPVGQDRWLLAALDAKDPAIRWTAALALRRSAAAKTANQLVDRLDRSAETERGALALALGGALSRSSDRALNTRLVRSVQGARAADRDALLEAWGRLPSASAPLAALAERGSTPDRAKVAEMLARHTDATIALIRLAKDPDGSVRANAVWSLGAVGDPGAEAVLKKALGDRDIAVAGNAAAAYARWGLRHGRKLAPVLCAALIDSRSYVRVNALAGLSLAAERCEGDAERRLLLRDRSSIVRERAAWLLQGTKSADERGLADQEFLRRCERAERVGRVALACASGRPPAEGAHEDITVFVVPSGRTEPLARGAFSLARPDGLLRFGLSDRRGAVFEAEVPLGDVSLEVPAALSR
jgi:cellulose synthase operon protein C